MRRTDYPAIIAESVATLRVHETAARGTSAAPRIQMLRLLKSVTADYKWARTDKNGVIAISFPGNSVKLEIDRGRLNGCVHVSSPPSQLRV